MQVVELELEWREQISFTLTQNFALKRIQFLDVLKDLITAGKLAGYIIYLLLMLPATIRRRSQQINRRKT